LAYGQNHVDVTAVTLGELIAPEGEHFLVVIDHIEDEIDVNGKILAERDVHVALQFDILDNLVITVNGNPVAGGYSQLTVQAAIVEIDEDGKPSPFDKLVSVDVRIFVGQKMVPMPDGSIYYGIYIQERVVGIQEKEVWQATVKEQVFIIKADASIQRLEAIEVTALQGEIEESKPQDGKTGGKHGHGKHHGHHHGKPGQEEAKPDTEPEMNILPVDDVAQEEPANHHGSKHGNCLKKFLHKVMNWFHSLPFYLRLVVSFGGGLILGFVAIAFVRCICCTLCRKRTCNKEENYKKNIHLYSLQYTSVPQDEKDSEKKAAPETV